VTCFGPHPFGLPHVQDKSDDGEEGAATGAKTLDNGSQLCSSLQPLMPLIVLQHGHSTGLIKMYDFSSFDETKYNFSTSNATERKKVGCNCNFLAKSALAARYILTFLKANISLTCRPIGFPFRAKVRPKVGCAD